MTGGWSQGGETMRWRGVLVLSVLLGTVLGGPAPIAAEGARTILIHIKTGLKQGNAQIPVAYDQIWAALAEGLNVRILVDANAVHAYMKGEANGWEDLEEHQLPESLRQILARDFRVQVAEVPRTYGAYLRMLQDKGAKFYVNSEMLVAAKIKAALGKSESLGPTFFTPVGPRQMLRLRREADLYMVY